MAGPRVDIQVLGGTKLRINGERRALTTAPQRAVDLLVAYGEEGASSDDFAQAYRELEKGVDWDLREPTPKDMKSAWRAAVSRLGTKHELFVGTCKDDSPGGCSGNTKCARHHKRYVLTLAGGHVDLWQLLNDEVAQLASHPDLTERFLTGGVFLGHEVVAQIARVRQEVRAKRTELIGYITDHRDDLMSASLLTATRRLTRDEDARDTEFVRSVVELHCCAGDESGAVAILDRYFDEMWGTGIPSKDLVAIRNELTSNAAPPVAPTPTEVPPQLRAQLTEPFIGRRAALQELTQMASAAGPLGAFVSGPSGSGKTRLLAEAACAFAREGHRMVYANPMWQTSPHLSAFRAAFPELRELAATSAESTHLQMINALDRARSPVCLIIDDAQWLDDESKQLIAALMQANLDPSWTFIIASRPEDEPPSPDDFAMATRDGLRRIELSAFDHEELDELLRTKHGLLPTKVRTDIATRLIEAGLAIPRIATGLSADAIEATLTGPAFIADSSAAAIGTVNELRPAALEVAKACAVLGSSFLTHEVQELCRAAESKLGNNDRADEHGKDTDELVMLQLDELIQAKLIQAGDEVSRLVFSDRGLREELMSQLSPSDRARLVRAAPFIGTDTFARPKRMAGAPDLFEQSEIVKSLVDAGSALLAEGKPYLAKDVLQTALEITDGTIDAAAMLDYARALDRTGGDGRKFRANAVHAYLEADDHNAAVAAALTDEYESERVQGDAHLVTLLHAISPTESRAELKRNTALARHQGMLGRHDAARVAYTEAAASAQTPDEKFGAWMGQWPTCLRTHPDDWPAFPCSADELTDLVLAARREEVGLHKALALGESQSVIARVDYLLHDPATDKIGPVRRWHLQLLASTCRLLQGRWDAAAARARSARELGFEQGIRDAALAFGAQQFLQRWVQRDYATIVQELRALAPEGRELALFKVALGAALVKDGDPAGYRLVTSSLKDPTELLHPLAPCVCAIASCVLDPNEDSHATSIAAIKKTLSPLRGTALVVGAGLGYLGPVDFYLALLEADPERRTVGVEQAKVLADKSNLGIWMVILRGELADLTGSNSWLTEAYDLVDEDVWGPILKGQGRAA